MMVKAVMIGLLLGMVGKMYAYDFSAICPSGQTLYYNITDAMNCEVEITQPGTGYYWFVFNNIDLVLPQTVYRNGLAYTVKAIGDGAFRNCHSITSVSISESITLIGKRAFEKCNYLTTVINGNSVTLIDELAFFDCQILSSFAFSNSLTSIGESAFLNCFALSSVNFSNSLTTINSFAFDSCIGLTSIVIPSSVSFIGTNPFINCPSLEQIIVECENETYDSRNTCNAVVETNTNTLIIGCKNTAIPNSVFSIGKSAFGYCTNLTSVEIPSSVTSIKEYAFWNCNSLAWIMLFGEIPPTLSNGAFNGVIKTIPIYVQYGTSEAYMSAPGWSEFTNYQEMPPVNTTQTVELSVGWNWFSPNVEITLEDLQNALVDALPNANTIMIKSKNGITTYNGDTWRGQLDSLDVTQMYRISVGTACEITLEGIPISPAEHPVTIHNGVNWIGFPLSENMTLNEAFSGFVVAGDMVKSKNGVATYNGTDWRGSLDTLEPGQGYIYKSNVQEDRTFTFPVSTK